MGLRKAGLNNGVVVISNGRFGGMSLYMFCLYCAFNIFQKVVLCLAIYTEEVNLQTFVMI